MKYKPINKTIVTPVQIKKEDINKIKGRDLFPRLYFNLFICAKKKSGKTSVINTIIDKCTDKRTKVYIFCSTINKDPTYKHITDKLENKGYIIYTFQDLYEGKNNKLEEIINELTEQPTNEQTDESEDDPFPFINTHTKTEKKKKKKRKPKYDVPDILFIFDDLGDTLRDKFISQLLKVHRHHKSCVIISSQYDTDIHPSAIKQCDHLLAFAGHDEDKMLRFYKLLDLTIPFDQFYNMYKEVTKEKYNFLYVDVPDSSFRKNFNTLIDI